MALEPSSSSSSSAPGTSSQRNTLKRLRTQTSDLHRRNVHPKSQTEPKRPGDPTGKCCACGPTGNCTSCSCRTVKGQYCRNCGCGSRGNCLNREGLSPFPQLPHVDTDTQQPVSHTYSQVQHDIDILSDPEDDHTSEAMRSQDPVSMNRKIFGNRWNAEDYLTIEEVKELNTHACGAQRATELPVIVPPDRNHGT